MRLRIPTTLAILLLLSFSLLAQGPSFPDLRAKARSQPSPEAFLDLAYAYKSLPDSAFSYLALSDSFGGFSASAQLARQNLIAASAWNRKKNLARADSLLQSALRQQGLAPDPNLKIEILCEASIVALHRRNYGKADSLTEAAYKISQKHPNGYSDVHVLFCKSLRYFFSQDFSQALKLSCQAEARLNSNTPWQVRGRLLNNLGTLNLHTGHYETGLCYLRESIALKNAFGDELGEATSLLNLGIIHNRKGNSGQAQSATREAEKIARNLGDSLLLANCLSNQGQYLRKSGKREEALRSMEEALLIYSLKGDEAKASYVCNSTALLFQDLGRTHDALRLLYRSLRLAREQELKQLQGFCHGNLSRLLWEQGFHRVAKEHNQKAFALIDTTETPIDQMLRYREIGFFYLQAGDIDQGERCMLALQSLASEAGRAHFLASALNGLAEVDLIQNAPKASIKKALQSLEILENSNKTESLSQALQILSKAHRVTGDLLTAEHYADRWLAHVLKAQLVSEFPGAYQLGSELANERGKTHKALVLLERGAAIRDSLAGIQKQKTLAVVQGLFDHREKQYQIRELSQNLATVKIARENDQLKAWKSKLTVLLIAGSLIFLGLLGILFFRKKSLARKAENLQLKLQASREREEMTQELRAVQQQALQTRMNPHFTFNCLNSIQALVLESDPERASVYLSRFARLVRMAFEFSNEKSISLEAELRFLKLYCELENLRFDNQVEVHFQIDPTLIPEMEEVPPMLIQPLIENAFQHGFGSRKAGAVITVDLRGQQEFLVWTIRDNGRGLQPARPEKMGIPRQPSGLKHAKKRLQMLLDESGFDRDDLFALQNVRDKEGKITGTEARLSMWRSSFAPQKQEFSFSTIHPADPTIR